MNRLLLLSLVVLTACPPVIMQPVDSGSEVEPPLDAGFDAGMPDAGRPPRDAGIPDAGFVSAPVNQWCALRALAECSRHLRCGRGIPSQIPGCVVSGTSILSCDQTALSRGVLGQRLSYDEGQAVECLNGFASGSCEADPPSCKAVFTGRSPPDAGCLSELDCNEDSFCDLYDSSCPHGCRPWSRLGESCDGFFRRCDPRVGSCDEGDGGIVMCVPLKTEGASCTRYDACAEGLVCTNS